MRLPDRLKHLSAIVPPQTKRPSLSVYVIQCNEFIKVGIASNVPQRLNELQVGNPYPLLLLGFWRSPSAIADEEAIHTHLNPYHERGEWFRLPPDMMRFVAMKLPGCELASRIMPPQHLTAVRADLWKLNEHPNPLLLPRSRLLAAVLAHR